MGGNKDLFKSILKNIRLNNLKIFPNNIPKRDNIIKFMGIQFVNYHPIIEELISLREASKISGISPNHLRLLVGKGKIWGKKIDTYWVTTIEAVKKYQSLGIKPGPKSKKP